MMKQSKNKSRKQGYIAFAIIGFVLFLLPFLLHSSNEEPETVGGFTKKAEVQVESEHPRQEKVTSDSVLNTTGVESIQQLGVFGMSPLLLGVMVVGFFVIPMIIRLR